MAKPSRWLHAAAVVGAVLLLVGGFNLPQRLKAQDEPERIKALVKERLDIARKICEATEESALHGAPKIGAEPDFVAALDRLAVWSRRWAEAQRDESRLGNGVSAIQL